MSIVYTKKTKIKAETLPFQAHYVNKSEVFPWVNNTAVSLLVKAADVLFMSQND